MGAFGSTVDERYGDGGTDVKVLFREINEDSGDTL